MPVLNRLEGSGAIAGREVPCPDAPARTEYTITRLGESRLAAWLAEPDPPISIHRIRVQFLSRLYIAALLGLPADGIITRQLAVCEAHLAIIQKQVEETTSPVESLTLDFVLGQLTACIAWLRRCRTNPLNIPARAPTPQGGDVNSSS